MNRNSNVPKLEIPDPDQPRQEDPTKLSLELWLSFALTVVLFFFGWFIWVQPQLDEPEPFANVEDDDQRHALQDRARYDQYIDGPGPDRGDWVDDDELARIFEVGSRSATEAACRHVDEELSQGDVSRRASTVLRQGISRRGDDVPWSCLTRLYVEDALPEESELTAAFSSFWDDVFALDDHGELMATVVDDLRGETMPDTEMFNRWLRRCALDLEYVASGLCQHALRNRDFDTDDDLLEMLLGHLASPDTSPEEFHRQFADDLEIATRALGYFVRYGQPAGWRIEETNELPDYDVDFRLGSLFQLCRLINAPDDDVQSLAADALGDIAEIGGRPHNPHMHYRWRKTCRYTFGDPEQPDQHVPILGVLMVDDDRQTVDYSLQTLIGEGLCEVGDELPVWFCGARRWTGGSDGIRRVLGRYFAQTGYVEWYDLDELAEAMPQE